MTTIERAIALAAEAHAGQLDKQGEPYILHLLRVMLAVEGPDARIVAVLHDLLEDTNCTRHDLRSIQCTQPQIDAIWLLTRARGENYMSYIHRLSANSLAVQVKVADLRDNLSRIDGLKQEDQERLRPRYEEALAVLAH